MSKDKEINFNNNLVESLTTYKDYANQLLAWNGCLKCNLCTTRNKVVFASGNPKSSKITILGEAPGPDENKEGIPFIGKVGTFLRQVIEKVGIKDEDLFWTNSIACEPKDLREGHFRTPTPEELIACRPRLKWLYENVMINHKSILLFGKVAYVGLVSMLYELDDKEIVKLNRSSTVGDNLGWHKLGKNCPMVYFTYHPSYIERSNREKTVTQAWINDIKAVKQYMDTDEINVLNNRKVIEYAKG